MWHTLSIAEAKAGFTVDMLLTMWNKTLESYNEPTRSIYKEQEESAAASEELVSQAQLLYYTENTSYGYIK